MPYANGSHTDGHAVVYDSGDYPLLLEKGLERFDLPAMTRWRSERPGPGRRRGIGNGDVHREERHRPLGVRAREPQRRGSAAGALRQRLARAGGGHRARADLRRAPRRLLRLGIGAPRRHLAGARRDGVVRQPRHDARPAAPSGEAAVCLRRQNPRAGRRRARSVSRGSRDRRTTRCGSAATGRWGSRCPSSRGWAGRPSPWTEGDSRTSATRRTSAPNR